MERTESIGPGVVSGCPCFFYPIIEMKLALLGLVVAASVSMPVLAAEDDKPLAMEQSAVDKMLHPYEFKVLSISPCAGREDYEGHFLFTNKGKKAVMVSGFYMPVNGKFQPRFEEFQTLQDGAWKELPQYYCGTGAQDFAMKPGVSYEFVVGLGGIARQDTPLTLKVGVSNYWSDPFVLDWKKDRESGKFEAATKANFAKVRAAFEKAGFKKEMLAGDDFCDRLIGGMMNQTLTEKAVASFHPFVGKLKIVPMISLNGVIEFSFESDELRDDRHYEYSGSFELDPRKFNAKWYRKAVGKYIAINNRGDGGVEMALDDGTLLSEDSTIHSPFKLTINYAPFDKAKAPSDEAAQELFTNMLDVMAGWLKE